MTQTFAKYQQRMTQTFAKRKDGFAKYQERRNVKILELTDALAGAVHGSAMLYSIPVVKAVTEFIANPTDAGMLAEVLRSVSEMHEQEKKQANEYAAKQEQVR